MALDFTMSDESDCREQSTPEAQTRLWEIIRNKQLSGAVFIRQVLIEPFIVDFACIELKLIIELDSGPNTERQCYDLRRTEYLRTLGFEVIRFFYCEVLSSLASVQEKLQTTLEQRAKEFDWILI
jgi:very-short-patch-repair endonuclease